MAVVKRRRVEEPAPPAEPHDIVSICDATARTRIKVAGEVTRMRARPTSGLPALAVTIDDGTGTATAVWTGRRSIGGITLGRSIVIDGVAVLHGTALEFTNPAYTLKPR